jgi:hypothetical protein
VSPSHAERVKEYIANQDEHHKRKSFKEEYQTLLKNYSFEISETDESVSD